MSTLKFPAKRIVQAALLGASLSLASVSTSNRAEAAIVERVVAVVGEQAILLSDLRQRAKPILLRVYRTTPAGAQRAAATSQVYKEVLQLMVDEELQRRAANQARITISAQEVDEAIARVARQNRLTVEKLLAEALSSGISIKDYRSEIRRQLLDAKLMNMRIAGRIRITEEDVRASYRSIVLDERRKLPVRVAWIHVAAPNEPEELDKQRAFARSLVGELNQGADFAQLALRHSADTATRHHGGLLPEQLPSAFPAALSRRINNLEVGEVSDPIRVGDAFVILRVVERAESDLPTYDEAHTQLQNRVYMEKMGKAREQWLRNLRKRTHVEVRL